MNYSESRSLGLAARLKIRPGLAFGVIIVVALGAFEMFNYSTTEYALKDLLGNLTFFSINWATILSIAFCGIDFAGIARLFTPHFDNPALRLGDDAGKGAGVAEERERGGEAGPAGESGGLVQFHHWIESGRTWHF